MTNKTKAIVMANKQLRAENRALWQENEMVRNGADEMEAMYRAMVVQLVQKLGGTVTLEKIDVAEMRSLDVEAQRGEDGALTLRTVKREADDGEEH